MFPLPGVLKSLFGGLGALLRDSRGNTSLIVAASIVPLLAMVGGGIDMGRSYLTESRLQQACDAGVLAARKKLGSTVVTDGLVPANVATTGNKFFNINFRSGTYGTNNRSFVMTLESDYSISGVATADVPTTIMKLFAFTKVPVRVVCEARLNYTNTDVMMVLDVTGSMNTKNPGDTQSRMEVMKSVVQNFHAQLEGSKGPGIRIRYGFVPYAVNVNVGGLLADDWVVKNWTYQSREDVNVSSSTYVYDWTYQQNWRDVSGSYGESVYSSYAATYHAATAATPWKSETEPGSPGSPAWYSCDRGNPAGTYTYNSSVVSTTSVPFTGPPSGTKTTKLIRITENGTSYWQRLNGTTCEIVASNFNNKIREYEEVTQPAYGTSTTKSNHYAPLSKDVSNWRYETNGCIEERDTYEINDYNNVDFNRALDLDIDRVPTKGQPATQWRPYYPYIIFGRTLDWEGKGSWSVPEVTDNNWYFQPANYSYLVACPAPARKLAEMTATDISNYLSSLSAAGKTYHDIGMIWGGRLISPTGLFATENAALPGKPTNRHLIFLTDGQTETLDLTYGPYGIEPLDQRRCSGATCSTSSLTTIVESRFAVACNEVKKRNVTVWVIGFGTTMNQVMKDCAGNGRWFQADDASQLNSAFSKIAASMGDLRISK